MMIARAIQGLGFGGEWVAGAVLVGEVADGRLRGRPVGFVQSAWAIGWGVAALAAAILLQVLPAARAWRVLFLLGVTPAFLIFYIRRSVPESPLFIAGRKARNSIGGLAAAIFARNMWTLVVRGALLAMGVHGGYYAVSIWLPTFLRTQHHLSMLSSGPYLAAIISGSFGGYLSGAILCDKIGRRPTFIAFAAGSGLISTIYTHLAISNEEMLILGFPLGFLTCGIFSGLGSLYTELFPTLLRASAQGFCYNFGRGMAALFPFLIGWISTYVSLGDGIAIFSALAYILVILVVLILPETRGRDLSLTGALITPTQERYLY